MHRRSEIQIYRIKNGKTCGIDRMTGTQCELHLIPVLTGILPDFRPDPDIQGVFICVRIDFILRVPECGCFLINQFKRIVLFLLRFEDRADQRTCVTVGSLVQQSVQFSDLFLDPSDFGMDFLHTLRIRIDVSLNIRKRCVRGLREFSTGFPHFRLFLQNRDQLFFLIDFVCDMSCLFVILILLDDMNCISPDRGVDSQLHGIGIG